MESCNCSKDFGGLLPGPDFRPGGGKGFESTVIG